MLAKTMEGLTGARTNLNLRNVPMKVYKEARRKGDLGTMERAMDYAGDFTEKAEEYRKKADEGMQEEAEEAKKQEQRQREKLIEKRKAEREQIQEKIESEREEKSANKKEHTIESTTTGDSTEYTEGRADTVQLSTEGKEMLKESAIKRNTNFEQEPVLYTKSGKAAQAVERTNVAICASV